MDDPSARFFNQRLLIAMPQLAESWFDKTLIYVIDHTEGGAMGLVVNRPAKIMLTDIMEQLRPEWVTPKRCGAVPIMCGGPVQAEKGFVIHTPDDRFSSLLLSDGLCISNAQEVLYNIAEGYPPDQYSIFLGCTGWDSGQLEQEVMNNSWWVTDFNQRMLFDTPFEDRLTQVTEQLGVDLSRIHHEVGHA